MEAMNTEFSSTSGVRPMPVESQEETDEGYYLNESGAEYMMSGSDEVQVFEDNDSEEDDDVVVLSQQQLDQQYQYMEEHSVLSECVAMEIIARKPWSSPQSMTSTGLREEQQLVQASSPGNFDLALKPLSQIDGRTRETAAGFKKPSTSSWVNPSDPVIQSACQLVQEIYDQITLHDSPAVNDSASNTRKDKAEPISLPDDDPFFSMNRGSSQRHDIALQTQRSHIDISSFDSNETSQGPCHPGLLRQELQLHKLGGPLKEQPGPAHSYFKHLQKQPDSKMGHIALGTLCSWTLETMQANTSMPNVTEKKKDREGQTPLSSGSLDNKTNKKAVKDASNKTKWNLKSYWKKKNKHTSNEFAGSFIDATSSNEAAENQAPEKNVNALSSTEETTPSNGITASILTVSITPTNNSRFEFAEERLDRSYGQRMDKNETEVRHSEAGSSPRNDAIPRLQMFGSEYARYLSCSAFAPKIRSPRRLPQQSASSRYGPFLAKRREETSSFGIGLPQIMNSSSFGTMFSRQKKTGNTYSWNLEDQDTATLVGAIVDMCVTIGADTPPPKGYYRISQTVDGEDFQALKGGGGVSPRRKNQAFINVKKEPNWHRAAQRPCVTALAIVFPDRQEFVPPGFCVVREHRRQVTKLNHGKQGGSGGSVVGSTEGFSSVGGTEARNNQAENPEKEELPANFNQGSAGEERVYLCLRRSREGNPITGILPLQPAFQEAIPDGYTVLERSPRSFVASLNPNSTSPVFLAYRQRLANLEPLRPLPLVLSITAPLPANNEESQKASNKKPKLNAYYCTGGTVVEANVGRYHIMDRSTHALLSSSSVASRLSLIELSRRKTLPQLSNFGYGISANESGAGRSMEATSSQTQHSSQAGDLESVASSAGSSHNRSFGSSIAEYPKDLISSFNSTGSFPSEQSTKIPSTITEESAVPSVILSSFPASSQQADGYYPKLCDPELKLTQDALSFIPVVETATPPSELGPQQQLRARTTLIVPILTACYQRHGSAALKAVEGLTQLLKEADFFADDVDWSSTGATKRLTLLDLTIQVVCDVATSGAQETSFGACVDFIGSAMQYSQGHLNTRTIGYVLRFYLFVYYFGASTPANKTFPHVSWNSSKNVIMPILYDPRTENNISYLPGGAPQLAALCFKEFITVTVTRLQRACQNLPTCPQKSEEEGVEVESTHHFISGIVSLLIDGAVHRVDVANYTQLAMHQIHRSGGSELFWHDMMTSCGTGLFRNESSLGSEAQDMYVTAFTILANLIKVASGKIRTNAQTQELRPRDVSSKLLSLELLLHFLEQYNKEQQGWLLEGSPKQEAVSRCVETMVFCIRRLIVTCLLYNTKAGLDEPRVFSRMVQILSVLWRTPLYRERMKGEIGMLIEHFGLRMLRLGPQLLHVRVMKQKKPSHDDLTCPLLSQQLDLLSEISRWFSKDPKSTIEMYLNFDTDISSQISGPSQLLPGTQWKVFQRICAGLCNLAEQCGDLIGEQIRQSQLLESPSGSSKTRPPSFFDANGEAQSKNIREEKKVEMESVRDGARRLRRSSLDAIVQILKCLAKTSAYATGKDFYALVSSWSDPGDIDEFQDENMPAVSSPSSESDAEYDEVERRIGGPGAVLNYWRNEASRRKLKPSIYNFDHGAGLLNSVTRDTAFEIAQKKSIKKAIEYLIACNALTPSPRDIASFLRIHKDKLDQSALGNYLGEGGTDGQEIEYWNLIRFSYVRAISFDGMKVEDGLRHFLTNCGFRLPGEAQKIDRIMSTFAQCYWEDNAGDTKNCPFQDQDTIYLLAFAIIMLNTDLHKAVVVDCSGKATRKKITKQEFIKNLAGVEGAELLTKEYLSTIYDSIEATPIILMHDDVDAQNLSGPEESRDRMLRSMLGNVRSADALLRGLSVHDFKWASMQDFSNSLEYARADALSDLTRSCISEAWHQFHGVVNTALETAHLDPQGTEPCVDLLKYALVVTICLDMPMERTAFLSQLGRFKVFGGHRNSSHSLWVPDEEQGRQLLLQGNPAFDRALAGPLDEESKFKALIQVHEATQDLKSALKVDIAVKEEMSLVTHQILDGEFLLNDPCRSFIRMGDLRKKSNRSGRQMEYRFFLFSDVLMYTKKIASKDSKENEGAFFEPIDWNGKKDGYKIHEELPLHLMKIVDWFPPSAKDMKKAFKVHHPRKTFMVYCSSVEERIEWVGNIRKAIEREIKKKVEMEAARMAAASLNGTNSMVSHEEAPNIRIPTPRPY